MPVRRFRSVADMPPPPPYRPLDPDNLRTAFALIRFLHRLRPWRYQRGVRKFRSLEAANQARSEWEAQQ